MNPQDKAWLAKIKQRQPRFFTGKDILELGSQDVTGANVWTMFENCRITGVDPINGPNVTLNIRAAHTNFAPESFDVVMSFNHLEHDPDWQQSIAHNLPALKVGGLLMMRCCNWGSAAHGPNLDPSGKRGYYPKTPDDLAQFAIRNGLVITENGKDQNWQGPISYLLAQKPNTKR